MGFRRQEYWSGLPSPSPRDLPDPGIEPCLLHCRQILYHLSHKGSPTTSSVVIQSLNCVWFFVTPRTAALQISLSFNISWSLLKLMSIESVMPSNHLILSLPPPPFAFSLSQHQGHFQRVGFSHQVAKVLGLQLQHQSFQRIFRMDFL